MKQNKKILGLDIGVSSVGLAIVADDGLKKEIIKMSVRVVPEDSNFQGQFYSGNTASKNLDRTRYRSVRRNNQRFKARRDRLKAALENHNMYPDTALMNLPTQSLYGLRARAVTEILSLRELGRVLLLLNQRRGFLSNRKSNTEEENSSEYKERIKELEGGRGDKTIGQQLYCELEKAAHPLEVLLRERTYLRSSYVEEFDRIWECQKQHYPDVLTGGPTEENDKGTLYDLIRNKIIYYQRPLKSQKNLVSNCSFEKHHKAVSSTSPYFELFRIWQRINDLSWKTADGRTHHPSKLQKQQLKEKLWKEVTAKSKHKLTRTQIKEVLGYKRSERVYLNFEELEGSRTYAVLRDALNKAGVENTERFLCFDPDQHDEKGGLFQLWHITYSLPTEKEVISALVKHFSFSESQSKIIAQSVGYSAKYGRLSTRAIRKLLPKMQEGLAYSDACDQVGYDHSGHKAEISLKPKLDLVSPNELRNPVVEQVLNQVVNMVNQAIDQYGGFDEIRVELARELRNSAENRRRLSKQNRKNQKINNDIRTTLQNEYGLKVVNGRDIKRYKLWNQTQKQCLYCSGVITKTDLLNGNADIEHILPRSRSFSDHMNNFILAHSTCNKKKGQRTAYDFMESQGEEKLNRYMELINRLYNEGKGTIDKAKFENLTCRGENIPNDFVERMKKDTQYISREAVARLKSICKNTYTTTGQVTDLLRKEWGLKHLLEELSLETYKAAGQTEQKEYKDSEGNIKTREVIKGWSKRMDHRHHAVDALICALTDQKIIFKLNNLNKIYLQQKEALTEGELKALEGPFDLKEFVDQGAYEFPLPVANLRAITKGHLEGIFVSIKKSSKVVSKSVNVPINATEQITWTPRGRLHEETVMGKVRRIAVKPVRLNKKFDRMKDIAHPCLKKLVIDHLQKFNDDTSVAFSAKTLKSNPILFKNKEISEVKVYEYARSKRVALNGITLKEVTNITDEGVKKKVMDRVADYGEIEKARASLNEFPIWLNESQGIQIKSVTVYEESKVEKVREGYVKTGKNHHALIYKNEQGKYVEKVVSFWEAVEIGRTNIQATGKPYPIINRSDDVEKGTFLFSLQINDLFVFDLRHATNPQVADELNFLLNENRPRLSKKLFRLQKISKKSNGTFEVNFRHHLESTIDRNIPEVTWIRITSNKNLRRLTKIRLNHMGQVEKIGE